MRGGAVAGDVQGRAIERGCRVVHDRHETYARRDVESERSTVSTQDGVDPVREEHD